MCGRRWGKSAFGIRRACDVAIAGHPVGWFAPNYKVLTEAWRELVQRLAPITGRINEQDKRLELVTGGVIECWSMDGPDPGRSRKYKLAIVDEAGIVANLLTIWQQSIRPTLVDYAGHALFLGTPKGRRHGFVTLFARGMGDDPDWQSFRAPTLENPYIPPEEVESARRELPPEIFAQEFEGVPSDDGMCPFGIDKIRAAIGPLSTEPPVTYGVDLARAMDYTVVVGLDAWRRVCLLERWQMPWALTKTKIRAIVGETPVVADATGVGDAIVADLQLMGVLATPYVFTQASKTRLMQRLIAAFQGDELQIPAGWLPDELETFEVEFTATGVKYEGGGEHDDGVMALALALHGWDRVQGVVPEAPPGLRLVGDDPHIAPDGGIAEAGTQIGVFSSQLPGTGW